VVADRFQAFSLMLPNWELTPEVTEEEDLLIIQD
jgi:hypothetical protein